MTTLKNFVVVTIQIKCFFTSGLKKFFLAQLGCMHGPDKLKLISIYNASGVSESMIYTSAFLAADNWLVWLLIVTLG